MAIREPQKPKRFKPLVNNLTAHLCHKYEGWLDRGVTESEKLAKSIPVEKGKIIPFEPCQH